MVLLNKKDVTVIKIDAEEMINKLIEAIFTLQEKVKELEKRLLEVECSINIR